MSSLNLLSHQIIGATMRVHTSLGPGLLESSYEACLAYELHKLNPSTDRQIHLPLRHGIKRLVHHFIKPQSFPTPETNFSF